MYLIFALIDLLSFSPITCPENTDHFTAIDEPDSQNSVFNAAEAVIPRLVRAMRKIVHVERRAAFVRPLERDVRLDGFSTMRPATYLCRTLAMKV